MICVSIRSEASERWLRIVWSCCTLLRLRNSRWCPSSIEKETLKQISHCLALSEWLREPRFQHSLPAAVIHFASTLWALSRFAALVSDRVMAKSEIITGRMAINQNFLSFQRCWQLKQAKRGKTWAAPAGDVWLKINFPKSLIFIPSRAPAGRLSVAATNSALKWTEAAS